MDALVRPARMTDKQPLMSFIKDVWGGHDYIPYVWDSWLHDRKGKMFVVEVGGVPVGMNRLSFPRDGSAWFQGARVHPEYRGRGLATLLGENSMRVAEEAGAKVFRLTTNSRNFPSIRQTTRMGFKEVARYVVYAPPKGKKPHRCAMEKVPKGETESALNQIRETKEYRLGAGVWWHDFAVASLTEKVVAGLAGEGAVWRLGEALAVSTVGGEGYETWEEVGFVGGPAAEAVNLVRALMGRVKAADARWAFVPHGSPIVHSLRRLGYRREFSQILFERRAANG